MTIVRKQNNLMPSWFEDYFTPDTIRGPLSSFNLPAVNIHEDNEKFTLEVAAPGLTKEDFHVEVKHDTLIISSEKEEKSEQKDENGKYSRKEFSYKTFRRAFTLPEKTVDTGKISARYAEGILFISIPKKEEQKVNPVKTISVA